MPTTATREYEMFEHEIAAAARTTDLLREAAAYRVVRQARKARRTSLRGQEPRGRVTGSGTRGARSAPRPA
ncbi:hypothetical protein [Streptomyces erythrochromogenes]|uniref:Uncharacterized protein n=2 Tax=Streptomyces erythrochromogenes TaxID=285574 RepID=A0ABZ1Q9D9_9ACTN|nr:hypothetical protein [Streptomyces erythrochromogenes]MCX5584336.1 hypothetical protein [Streptomyces erythrochromogenes]